MESKATTRFGEEEAPQDQLTSSEGQAMTSCMALSRVSIKTPSFMEIAVKTSYAQTGFQCGQDWTLTKALETNTSMATTSTEISPMTSISGVTPTLSMVMTVSTEPTFS